VPGTMCPDMPSYGSSIIYPMRMANAGEMRQHTGVRKYLPTAFILTSCQYFPKILIIHRKFLDQMQNTCFAAIDKMSWRVYGRVYCIMVRGNVVLEGHG
jgi:hypothetical protein